MDCRVERQPLSILKKGGFLLIGLVNREYSLLYRSRQKKYKAMYGKTKTENVKSGYSEKKEKESNRLT
jgi:hypothetical protein